MPLVNFTKFNLSQLREISRELEQEIGQRAEEEREKAAAEIKKIANAVGMTVEEILVSRKKRGRNRQSAASRLKDTKAVLPDMNKVGHTVVE